MRKAIKIDWLTDREWEREGMQKSVNNKMHCIQYTNKHTHALEWERVSARYKTCLAVCMLMRVCVCRCGHTKISDYKQYSARTHLRVRLGLDFSVDFALAAFNFFFCDALFCLAHEQANTHWHTHTYRERTILFICICIYALIYVFLSIYIYIAAALDY